MIGVAYLPASSRGPDGPMTPTPGRAAPEESRGCGSSHFEASIASAKAWLLIASLQLLVRRVARTQHNLADS